MYVSGTNLKISPQIPGKLDNFPVLALFSTCPSPKSGFPTPIKIIFLKLPRIELGSFKDNGFLNLIIVNSGSFKKLPVFSNISSTNGKKH